MSDENQQAAAEGQQDRSYGLQRMYVKDVSFEAPNTPEVFEGEWNPTMNMNIGTRARAVAENFFEVVLTVTIEARQEDKVAFLVELQQAGVFQVAGFNEQERAQILAIVCPQNLFPFAREAVANLTSKGGFPPLLLQPINFERLYQQKAQQQQGAAPQGEA